MRSFWWLFIIMTIVPSSCTTTGTVKKVDDIKTPRDYGAEGYLGPKRKIAMYCIIGDM